jgi:hypothetical protein
MWAWYCLNNNSNNNNNNTPIPYFMLLCFNAPCQFTPLHDLCSHICSLTPFGWLCSLMLNSYFWWDYNFLFMPFWIIPTFSGMQPGCKTRTGCMCTNTDEMKQRKMSKTMWLVMSFTQENAVERHSICRLDSLNTCEDGWGKTHRYCQKHGSQSLRDTSFLFNKCWLPFGRCFIYKNLNKN